MVCAGLPDHELFARLASPPKKASPTPGAPSAHPSPSTLAQYATRLRLVLRVSSAPSLCSALLDSDATKDALLRALAPSSPNGSWKPFINAVSSLIALINHARLTEHVRHGHLFAAALRFWKDASKDAYDAADKQDGPTDRQLRAALSWRDVLDQNEKLWAAAKPLLSVRNVRRPSAGSISHTPDPDPSMRNGARQRRANILHDALLSSIYTDQDPRRSDYWRVRVVRSDPDFAGAIAKDEPAMLDLRGVRGKARPTLTVRKYKTAKVHGPFSFALPPRTWALARASLALQPRGFLFARRDGSPFSSSNAFTKHHNARLRAWFGNPAVSNNSVRKAAASFYQYDLTASGAKKAGHARNMGHGLASAMRDYAVPPALGKDGALRVLMPLPGSGKPGTWVCRPLQPSAKKG